MTKTNILKIILIIVFSYFLSSFIKNSSNINYDSVTLDVNIDFFDTDTTALAHRKLYSVYDYGTIANYFAPKQIALRINKQLKNSKICKRDTHAKKRNMQIIPEETAISLSIIFLNEINAQKCLDEIENYIGLQKKLFLQESGNTIKKFLKKQKVNKGDNFVSDVQINELLENIILPELDQIDKINRFLTILQLKSLFSSIDEQEFAELFSIIEESEIFIISSNIVNSSNDIFKGLEFEYLFILVLVLLTLIFYRKEIEIYFKKIKEKL